LLAANPLFVRYAQEARGYELSLLLVIVASYLFVRGLEQPSWATWIAYALVASLSAYAHVFALLVPASHAVSLLFREQRRALPWRKLLSSAGLFVLSLAPLAYLLTASSQSSAVGWVGNSNAPGRLFIGIHDRPPIAVATFALGIATPAFAYWLLSRRLGPQLHTLTAWRWGFVLSWLLVPPALVAAVAIVYEPLFLARYFIVCLPAAVLLLALTLERVGRRRLVATTTFSLVLLSLLPVVRWYMSGEAENWRGATMSVTAAARPHDGVLFFASFTRVPFALYIAEKGLSDRAPTPIDPTGDWNTRTTVYGEYIPISTGYLMRSTLAHPRIWLVLSHESPSSSDYQTALVALAASGYRRRQLESFAGIEIALYARSQT
jgi:mannosyltransferase